MRTVFSVSRRPLQALEGCLARCCCSTTPTALQGCAPAAGRSHMVGERKIINVKNIPRRRSQILYIQTDRTEYDGAARGGKHLAARVPGWYRFWYRGAATTISSRLFPPLLLRVQTPPKLPQYITVPAGLRGVPIQFISGGGNTEASLYLMFRSPQILLY